MSTQTLTKGCSAAGSPTLLLPASLLTTGVTYNITLTLTNYLNSRSTSTPLQVLVTATSVPLLVLQAPPRLTVRPWQQLLLSASSSLSSCSGIGSATGVALSHAWFLDGVQLPDATNRYVVLPPYTLQASQEYTMMVVVTDANGLTNTASTILTTSGGRFKAVIGGGNYRSIGLGSYLRLDGSASFDDEEVGSSAASSLVYLWTCARADSFYGQACNAMLDPNAAVQIVTGLATGEGSLYITLWSTDQSTNLRRNII